MKTLCSNIVKDREQALKVAVRDFISWSLVVSMTFVLVACHVDCREKKAN